jgi:hypothetical protein
MKAEVVIDDRQVFTPMAQAVSMSTWRMVKSFEDIVLGNQRWFIQSRPGEIWWKVV